MKIGIVGLGLIGGSFAKAFKHKTPHTVLGTDAEEQIVCKAKLVGAIDDRLEDENLSECELIIIALYPQATIDWLEAHAVHIAKTAIVIDTCGVKQAVCDGCYAIAQRHGFAFIGAHPMAGVEHSGFDHSHFSIFENASMILVPKPGTPIALVDRLKKLMLTLGFGQTVITDPIEHDRMIAYTSQLAHVVSSAYVQTPLSLRHGGYSAGSYRDMTRVATLNEAMWTELFLDNSAPLAEQIDALIMRLEAFKDAIAANDGSRLHQMLKAGREQKMLADGKVL